MSDVEMNEIQEDIRLDTVLSFWQQYKKIIVGGITGAIILVTIGLVYTNHRAESRRQASQTLLNMLNSREDTEQNKESYDALVDALAPYPTLAHLTKSGQLINDAQGLDIQELEKIRNDVRSDATLREGTIILMALRRIEDANFPTALLKELDQLSASKSTWVFFAKEIRAFLAFKQDESTALSLFQAIVDDPAAPPGFKQRSQAMIDKMSEVQ